MTWVSTLRIWHFLIDHLGLECPAVLGVSFGGAIALEFAAEHPHRLGALILNGVEARFHRTIGSTIARLALERFPLPSDNPFINQFFHLLYGAKPEPGPLVDFVVDRIWETDQSVMAQRLAQLESFDVSDRLWNIDVPTLVLAGASRRDRAGGASNGCWPRESRVPDSQMIEHAGHVAFLTHRAEFVRDIRRHLRGSRRRSERQHDSVWADLLTDRRGLDGPPSWARRRVALESGVRAGS